MKPRSHITTLSLAMTLALSGCAIGPEYQPPEATLASTYLFKEIEGTDNRVSPFEPAADSQSAWWYQFNDPVLNELVREAQQQSIPLKTAALRVTSAQSFQQAVASLKVPTVTVGAGYNHVQLSENALDLGPLLTKDNPLPGVNGALYDKQQSYLGVGASVAWELDIFGRIDRQTEAAGIMAEQAELYREGLMSLITAEVIGNYLQLRGARERLAIASQSVDEQRETLTLVTRIRDSGFGSDLDVARASAMLAAAESSVPTLKTAESAHINRLAILLGVTPQAMAARLETDQPLPQMQGLIPVGLPSELLQRRPDLRLAEREMALQNEQLAIAMTDRYPRFFLTGSPGSRADDFSDLFKSDSLSWMASIGVSWSLFDGGRTEAMIKIREANMEASVHNYEQAVLTALGETETLLNTYGNSLQYSGLIQTALGQAQDAVDKAQSLYKAGLVEYLAVLDAQRERNMLRDLELVSRLQSAQTAVGLYKALGGDWELPLESEPGTETEKFTAQL